ncbi:MAG: hypothetical protein R2788_04405 [Saprospiraceae bacterium]
MKLITSTILTLSVFFSLLTSCDKDPDIITETVTVTDTVIVTQVDTVFISLTDTVTITEFMQDTATTFILVRHAETTRSRAATPTSVPQA